MKKMFKKFHVIGLLLALVFVNAGCSKTEDVVAAIVADPADAWVGNWEGDVYADDRDLGMQKRLYRIVLRKDSKDMISGALSEERSNPRLVGTYDIKSSKVTGNKSSILLGVIMDLTLSSDKKSIEVVVLNPNIYVRSIKGTLYKK
jgi:hypothetical protein